MVRHPTLNTEWKGTSSAYTNGWVFFFHYWTLTWHTRAVDDIIHAFQSSLKQQTVISCKEFLANKFSHLMKGIAHNINNYNPVQIYFKGHHSIIIIIPPLKECSKCLQQKGTQKKRLCRASFWVIFLNRSVRYFCSGLCQKNYHLDI